MKRSLFAVAVGLMLAQPVSALPLLQLDIGGGDYIAAVEGTVAQTDAFDLYALVQHKSNLDYSKDFFISVAVAPKVGPAEPTGGIGSFSVNGTSYSFSDLSYGSPAGMQPHGVYNTLYKEFSFKFINDAAHRVTSYNVADLPDVDPVLNTSGALRFIKFSIDVTGLDSDYHLIFDLYNKDSSGNVNKFAPFSHNAESGPGGDDGGGGGSGNVPDGGSSTLALLGVGMLGLFAVNRRGLARRS